MPTLCLMPFNIHYAQNYVNNREMPDSHTTYVVQVGPEMYDGGWLEGDYLWMSHVILHNLIATYCVDLEFCIMHMV